MTRLHFLQKAVAAGAMALVLPTLALAGTSMARGADADSFAGKVTAKPYLNVRRAPTPLSVKLYGDAGTTRMYCKVPGPVIDGNPRWYSMVDGGWATARYIETVGAAPPWCGDGTTYEGKVIARRSLVVRTGPNTGNGKITTLTRGGVVSIACKVISQSVNGNRRWYWVKRVGRDGWVTARYVENVGAVPPYCRP